VNGVDDLERSACGAQRVVLVREGRTEDGHQRVADELLGRPAVAYDHSGRDVEVLLQHALENLGVDRLRKSRRVDEVDEQDRREPPCRSSDGAVGDGTGERLVLAQDRSLERAQLRSGVDAEVVDERAVGVAVGGQRVGLPARSIEGDHLLAA